VGCGGIAASGMFSTSILVEEKQPLFRTQGFGHVRGVYKLQSSADEFDVMSE
jgi:hypothetical protein